MPNAAITPGDCTDAAINRVLALAVPIIWAVVNSKGEESSVLKDGTYAAWFKTPQGQGTGIAHVVDGKIWGRDSVMTYSGTCRLLPVSAG
jgi:hypothetical protein